MKSFLKNFDYICFCLLIISLLLESCSPNQEIRYYSDEKNFITVSAKINYIKYSEDNAAVYLGFENLPKEFSDNCFKIVGKNYEIILKNGFNEKVVIGEDLCFVTAPKYFGDGYVMPIVSISVGNDVLLSFEEGYSNFLEWLKLQ